MFRNYRLIAVDNNRTTVVVSVSVVVTVLPNNNRFVTISAVPIPHDRDHGHHDLHPRSRH